MARNPKAKAPDDRAALMKRARNGDYEAARQFREKHPEISMIIKEQYGRPSYMAREALLNLVYGDKDVLFKGFAEERIQEMRAELCGRNATYLECMVVDRILLCWLHLHYLEWSNARALKGTMPLEKAEFYQRCIDRAHRRHLAAIKSLAIIRRLQLPAVQLNIAEKQVNFVQREQATSRALPDRQHAATLPLTREYVVEGAVVEADCR